MNKMVPLFTAEHLRPDGLSNEAWEKLEREYAEEFAQLYVEDTEIKYTQKTIHVGGQEFAVTAISQNEPFVSRRYMLLEVLSALSIIKQYKDSNAMRTALINIASRKYFESAVPLYQQHTFTLNDTLEFAAELLSLPETRNTVISLSRLIREDGRRIVHASYQTEAEFISPADSFPYLEELDAFLPFEAFTAAYSVTCFELPSGFVAWHPGATEEKKDANVEEESVWWVCFRGPLSLPIVAYGGIPRCYAQEPLSREDFYICVAPRSKRLLYIDTEYTEFDYNPCVEAVLTELYGGKAFEATTKTEPIVVLHSASSVSLTKLEQAKWEEIFEQPDKKMGMEVRLTSATLKENRGQGACKVTYSSFGSDALHTVSRQAPNYQKLHFHELAEATILFSFPQGARSVLASLDVDNDLYSFETRPAPAKRSGATHERTPLAYVADASEWLVEKGFIVPAEKVSSGNTIAKSLQILLRGATRSYLEKTCNPQLLQYATKIEALIKMSTGLRPRNIVVRGKTYEVMPDGAERLPARYVKGKLINAVCPPSLEELDRYQLSLPKLLDIRLEIKKNGGYTLDPYQIADSGAYLVAGIPHRGETIFITMDNSAYDLECIQRHCGTLSKKAIIITTDEASLSENYHKQQSLYSRLSLEHLLSNNAPLIDLIGCTITEADTDVVPYRMFKYITRIPEKVIKAKRGKAKEEWDGVSIHLLSRKKMRATYVAFGRANGTRYSYDYKIKDVNFCRPHSNELISPYNILLHIAFARGEALDPIGDLNEIRSDMNRGAAKAITKAISEIAKTMNGRLRMFFKKKYDFFRNRVRSGTKDVKKEVAKRYDKGDKTNIEKWNSFHFYLNVTAEESLRADFDEFHKGLKELLLSEEKTEFEKAIEQGRRERYFEDQHGNNKDKRD